MSGEDALNVYQENISLIRLVILDLGMPGMGGQNCLKELLRLNPALKIIIASGYSETEHSAAAIRAGAKGFIKKPYRLAHMLHQVRDILDQ
jgi:DNA-binding NtrC family response regulator